MIDERAKKRKDALEQLREQEKGIWNSGDHLPAVHPRYRAAYESIYQDESHTHSAGTFWIRFLVSILLMAGFINLKDPSLPEFLPERSEIVRQIQKPLLVPSWKQFDLTHIL